MRRSVAVSVAALAAAALSIPVAVAVIPPVLTSDVTRVTYPGVVTLTATATAGSSPVAVFRMQPANAAGYSVLGTVPVSYADPSVYHFIVRPRRNATYTVEVDGMLSEPVYVPVHVPLTTPHVKAVVRPGTTARITGTIRPLHPYTNMDVQLQKLNARTRRWEDKLTSAVDTVTAIGVDTTRWTYDLKVTRAMAGLWRVRASHKCANHAQSYSEWRKFSVLSF